MKKLLYTIGHSTHSIGKFISLINIYNINCIVDIRSTPYSKAAPQFNMDKLASDLHNLNIYYLYMGKELGARHKDKNIYTREGYLDFEAVAKQEFFRQGIARVMKGVEKGFRIALMCSEKDPFDCHRSILVAKEFYERGYEIKHILENGDVISQADIEERLIDFYFPQRNQMSLFDGLDELSDRQLIRGAYKLRNKDIGYSMFNNEGRKRKVLAGS